LNERLALGTAQFGSAYGVTNSAGQPTPEVAAAIVARARAAGMNTIDTAIAYGDSESRLGQTGVAGWRVVTKLPSLPAEVLNIGAWVRAAVDGSLMRLRVSSVSGLLLHRSADLIGERGASLVRALRKERDDGRVEKIGVSIYDPSELDAIWPVLAPDMVQAPFSVLDRRLEASGWLTRLDSSGVEIHARSIFLQGLLLLPLGDRPAKFERWALLWTQWAEWLAASGKSALEATVGHALSYPGISRVVVGVDSLEQLNGILSAAAGPVSQAALSLATEDLDLINPSRWNAL
jgi:aryl-alcohol dehydrogenase-like predicted oxidoreductase